jgi:aspartate-semialdehyde dehydrogenase
MVMNAMTSTARREAAIAKPAEHPGLSGLADRRLLRQLSYIDGRWTAASDGETFPVTDPATGALIAQVAALGASEATQAIDAAHTAFPKWKALLPQERAVLLGRWHAAMLAEAKDLALLMTLEQGKPLAESRGEIAYAADFIAYYAEEALRVNAEGVTSHLPGAQMSLSRAPVGVAALLTPWNFPSAMLTRKAAAALAAGCTIVAHPSSRYPAFGAGPGRARRPRRTAGRRVQRGDRRCRADRRAPIAPI